MSKLFFPLHPAQTDLYVDQLIHIDRSNYNIGGYLKLKGRLNKKIFYEAIQSVPKVFDAFRMRIDCIDPNTPRCFYEECFFKLEVPELDLSNDMNAAKTALQWMQKRFAVPFVPGKHDLLFENVLIKIAADEYWL